MKLVIAHAQNLPHTKPMHAGNISWEFFLCEYVRIQENNYEELFSDWFRARCVCVCVCVCVSVLRQRITQRHMSLRPFL